MKYEYGVALSCEVGKYTKPFLLGMSEDQADEYVREWEGTARQHEFVKIRRPIVEWEVVE